MKPKTATLTALFIAFWMGSIAQNVNIGSPLTDTLQIPFIERFTEGSLEINNWETDCENWHIQADSGKPAPSVWFNGLPVINGEYNRMLTSDWITKENSGNSIYLRFESKCIFNNYTGEDSLFIDVFDSVNWITISGFRPYNNYWMDLGGNLRPYVDSLAGFKIRFRINGENSSLLDYWTIDNIYIYDGVDFPEQLEGNYFWQNNEFGVKLDWYYSETPAGWGAPVTWSGDSHCNNLGITDGGDWAFAAKWDSINNSEWDIYLYYVSTYIGDADFDSLVLKIWKGVSGEYEVYSENVTNQVIEDDYNSFRLVPTFLQNDSSATYVGFVIYNQPSNSYPAGYSCNDAVNGYGNLIKTDLEGSWDTLPEDFNNWVISLWFWMKPFRFHIDGYNIYKKEGDDTAYSFYAYVEDAGGNNKTFFDLNPNVDIYNYYSYQVRNVWINPWVIPEDTAISLPAFAKVNGDEDFVTVLVTHHQQQMEKETSLTAYPNPTTTYLNIKSESNLKEIHIYNLLGQEVDGFATNNEKQIEIDVSRLKKGVYLLKIETGIGVVSKKFIVE